MIRVLIADDQEPICTAFRMILEAQPDIAVVAEAANGDSAVEQARHLRPDVVLADIRMPGLNGLEVTRILAGPDEPVPPKVIVVTTFDLDDYVHTALRNGACGFILKRSSPTLLVEAVRAAAVGDALISPQITARLLRRFAAAAPDPAATRALTAREQEIAALTADGCTNPEIADRLFISAGTVKNHLAAIQRKIGARNRVDIAIWASDHNLRLPPS